MNVRIVDNALSRELRSVGVTKKLNCTKLRHLTVTLAYNVLENDKERKDLAHLLSHSLKIAEKAYNEKSSQCLMSKIVAQLLTATSLSEEDLQKADCGKWLSLFSNISLECLFSIIILS